MIFGLDPQGPPMEAPAALQEWPKQKAWSYSAVTSHAKCPLQFRFRRIDRLPEAPSEAMDRGSRVHAALAAYISTGELPERTEPALYAPWFPILDALRTHGAVPEQQIAFTQNWERTEWFASDVWVRVVYDAIVWDETNARVTVIEHKTGKPYNEHAQQMRLYCYTALRLYPEARDAKCYINYIDQGPARRPELVMTRTNMPELEAEFAEFSKEFLNDTLYPSRPGIQCRWCSYAKSKGGPCEQG